MLLHVDFANELVKALHHWGLNAEGTSPEVSYGNHQTIIIITATTGERVGITVEKVS